MWPCNHATDDNASNFASVVSESDCKLQDAISTRHMAESESVYGVRRCFDALFLSFTLLETTNLIRILQLLSWLRNGFNY